MVWFLVPPATGWGNCPLVTDKTPAADIARIQFHRNTVYSHASNASVDDAAFSSYWKEIKETLVRLGGTCYRDAIDDVENEIMGPEFEGHYKELLEQWVEDDNSVEVKLDEDDRGKKQSKLDDPEESIVDSEKFKCCELNVRKLYLFYSVTTQIKQLLGELTYHNVT